jgi:hypothetical protein
MTKRNANGPTTAPTPGSIDEMGSQMFEQFGQQQRQWLDSAGAMAEESWRFWSERMSAAADYLHALRACESAPEVVALNNGFVTATIAECQKEAQRIFTAVQHANGGAAAGR